MFRMVCNPPVLGNLKYGYRRENTYEDTADELADILEGIQAGTVTAITKVMEWNDRDSEAVVKVKERLHS